jgi:hypothetical protein
MDMGRTAVPKQRGGQEPPHRALHMRARASFFASARSWITTLLRACGRRRCATSPALTCPALTCPALTCPALTWPASANGGACGRRRANAQSISEPNARPRSSGLERRPSSLGDGRGGRDGGLRGDAAHVVAVLEVDEPFVAPRRAPAAPHSAVRSVRQRPVPPSPAPRSDAACARLAAHLFLTIQ